MTSHTETKDTPRVIPVCQVCDMDGPVVTLSEYLRNGGGQCCGQPRGLVPPPGECRKIVTRNIRPPVPGRQFDWQATWEGYDLGDPVGYGATEQAAIDDLREILGEDR